MGGSPKRWRPGATPPRPGPRSSGGEGRREQPAPRWQLVERATLVASRAGTRRDQVARGKG
eukprot:6909999-Alexandrium_andersonii.AAC.1